MSSKITQNGIGSTPLQRHYISHEQAQAVVQAAKANAENGAPQNIAVVDPSGLLVAFLRRDNAYPGSIDKARTCVLFNGITSAALFDGSQPGQALYGEWIVYVLRMKNTLTALFEHVCGLSVRDSNSFGQAFKRPMVALLYLAAASLCTTTDALLEQSVQAVGRFHRMSSVLKLV
jgi:hypothetical protein